MATPNKTIMAKADMEVADLIADGGYLQPEQAEMFVVDMIKESVLMRLVNVQTTKSHTKLLDKVGITGRVLRPGTSGHALAAADRVKPTTDQTTLTTHLMKAEIRLNDEVLEDNIEGGNFKSTVMKMMAEYAALDLDDLLANGDTASADPLLAMFDGMIKSAVTNIVAGGSVPIAKSMLKDAIKAMPSEYNRKRRMQRFLTSEDACIDYHDYLADRATALGDKKVEDDSPDKYGNRAILPVPVFPDDLGIGNDETVILLMDPKDAIWGFWRKMKVETDRDITTGEWIMVMSLRAGFQYKWEDAVVKVTGVKTQ